MPPRVDPKLTAVVKAGERVSRIERELEQARAAFYRALDQALEAGVSISAIARARGVSRQAIQKLVGRRGR